MLVDDRDLTAQAARIEALVGEIEAFPDAAARARAAEIVQGLLALYGAGLARMMAMVRQQGGPAVGSRIVDAFAADELIANLLLLHDLHPLDVRERVARALDEVRPYLLTHGGDVELVAVEHGVVRVRLQGSCEGCPSSTVTLKTAIEEAIHKAAPDVDRVEADGVAAPPQHPAAFVPAATIRRREKAPPAQR